MSIPPQSLPLPQWAYVPGETAEVAADYETLAQAKLLVPLRFGGYVPARHPALRYGSQPCGPAQGQIGVTVAVQGGLGGDRRGRPHMKQNADFMP
jgi:hypothetical protein